MGADLKLCRSNDEDLKSYFHLTFLIASDKQPVHVTQLESSSKKKIIMQTHSSWANWFINHENNDTGNKNIQAFGDILSSGNSDEVKLWALAKEMEHTQPSLCGLERAVAYTTGPARWP